MSKEVLWQFMITDKGSSQVESGLVDYLDVEYERIEKKYDTVTIKNVIAPLRDHIKQLNEVEKLEPGNIVAWMFPYKECNFYHISVSFSMNTLKSLNPTTDGTNIDFDVHNACEDTGYILSGSIARSGWLTKKMWESIYSIRTKDGELPYEEYSYAYSCEEHFDNAGVGLYRTFKFPGEFHSSTYGFLSDDELNDLKKELVTKKTKELVFIGSDSHFEKYHLYNCTDFNLAYYKIDGIGLGNRQNFVHESLVDPKLVPLKEPIPQSFSMNKYDDYQFYELFLKPGNNGDNDIRPMYAFVRSQKHIDNVSSVASLTFNKPYLIYDVKNVRTSSKHFPEREFDVLIVDNKNKAVSLDQTNFWLVHESEVDSFEPVEQLRLRGKTCRLKGATKIKIINYVTTYPNGQVMVNTSLKDGTIETTIDRRDIEIIDKEPLF